MSILEYAKTLNNLIVQEINGEFFDAKLNKILLTKAEEEQIQAKIKEIEAQEKVSNAYKSLQELCDTKSKQAKNYIAGKEVTDEQVRRYEEKYQIAKEYKASGAYADRLKLEADLQGLTVDELADLIIQKGDAWNEALIAFNARIEAFRIAVSKIIDAGDIDRANSIIEKAKELGADATDEDVKALFMMKL